MILKELIKRRPQERYRWPEWPDGHYIKYDEIFRRWVAQNGLPIEIGRLNAPTDGLKWEVYEEPKAAKPVVVVGGFLTCTCGLTHSVNMEIVENANEPI